MSQSANDKGEDVKKNEYQSEAPVSKASYSLESEQAVLGSILIDPACFSTVSMLLRPDYFYLPQHKAIYNAMLTIDAAAGGSIDPLLILEMLKKENAKKTVELINGKTVKISAKAGANGRLFGSVTNKDVAEKLKSDFGVDIDKKKIVIDDVRNFGTYECTVKVYSGFTAKMFVAVGE